MAERRPQAVDGRARRATAARSSTWSSPRWAAISSPRMIDLLGPGGRLVFYGATSGYTLTFLGKPGAAPAGEMLRRAGLRPHHGVLVYYGAARRRRPGGRRRDQRPPLHAGARVVVATRTDAEAARVKAAHRVAGRRQPGDAGARRQLPLAGRDAGLRRGPRRLSRVPGRARSSRSARRSGALLATPDNPRGNPDLIVERAGQDTLGISTFLARPFTGVVVYLEATADDRLVVLRAERVDAPEARALPDLRDPGQPSLQRPPGRGGRAAARRAAR